MQSMEIVSAALAMMLVGAAVLYYQFSGKRSFETMIAFCGVALVAGGFAMFQDGVVGSRKFLWMLPSAQPVAGTPSADRFAAHTPAPQSSAVSD